MKGRKRLRAERKRKTLIGRRKKQSEEERYIGERKSKIDKEKEREDIERAAFKNEIHV